MNERVQKIAAVGAGLAVAGGTYMGVEALSDELAAHHETVLAVAGIGLIGYGLSIEKPFVWAYRGIRNRTQQRLGNLAVPEQTEETP